ncbi:hypothetical protein IG518_13950 [Vibrio cholerae]|nr:hypothetical protein [Vibrio cholerae]
MSELLNELMTQEYFDESCQQLKEAFDEAIKQSGYDRIALAISCGKNKQDIMLMMAFYEFDVIPSAKKDGLDFKTTSELFGIEIKITKGLDEEK